MNFIYTKLTNNGIVIENSIIIRNEKYLLAKLILIKIRERNIKDEFNFNKQEVFAKFYKSIALLEWRFL